MEKRFEILHTTVDFPEKIKVWSANEGDHVSVKVKDLTRSEAEEYAKLMHDTFIKHWKEKHNTVNRKEK